MGASGLMSLNEFHAALLLGLKARRRPPRASSGGGSSGSSRGLRRCAPLARPARAVVNAEFTFDPELDRLDGERETAPVGRTRHLDCDFSGLLRAGAAVRDAEAARGRGDAFAHFGARCDGLALPARPGTDAALPRARAKIGVVARLVQRLDVPLGAH